MNFVQEHLVGRADFRAFYEGEGVRFRGRGEAFCPFHEDHTPSLSIDEKTGLFNCHAGGCGERGDPVNFLERKRGISASEAIAELRRRYNVDSPSRAANSPKVRRSLGTRAIEIRGVDGKVAAIHARTDFDDGTKTFSWAQPDGISGLNGKPLAELPLYRSEKIRGWQAGAPILVTEGEKAADALVAHEYRALGIVTGASGTPGVKALEPLRGHDVVLWPDNDDAGRDHMKRIAVLLKPIAKSVRILSWGKKPKDDAADFFARGGTEEQLDRMLAEAAEDGGNVNDVPKGWRTPAEVLEALPAPKFRFKTRIPSLNKAGREGLPTGIVVVLAGWPDAGKTGLGTEIVVDIAIDYDVVAVLFTPDGGQEATAIRCGGLVGLDQDKLEARDPDERAALASKLRDRRIFIVDDSQEGMVFERIVSDAEKFRPDLPHIYLLDSAQECLATEKADELDERHRAIALMRVVYRTVEANPIPSLAIVTSQVSGQAFAPGRRSDRTAPIGAPAESKKISFLSHLIVSLEGDPGREPEFGRAAVVKSKLRGPKPSFTLKVDARTSRLEEIDAVNVADVKEQTKAQTAKTRVNRIADRIETLLLKSGPLMTGDIQERVTGDKSDIKSALDALEGDNRAVWEKAGKTGKGRLWRATGKSKGSDS